VKGSVTLSLAVVALVLLAGAGATTASRSDSVLTAWRKPDKRKMSCASCHSPDGIELSAYGFSREDIVRRATAHVDLSDAEAIADLIQAGASRAAIKDLDPMAQRPFQPGGEPLAGATAAERDRAFLDSLPSVIPTLAEGDVNSEEAAVRARDELLKVDLSQLRIGIALNRLSEDGFHGNEHRTVASWVPDVPLQPKEGSEAELTAVQDRYLADPTDDHLRELDLATRNLIEPASTPGEMLALAKYRSLLILTHRLRTGRLAKVSIPHRILPNQNPFWEVGDFARLYDGEESVDLLAMPADIAQKKVGGPGFGEQLRQLRLPWFWAGWMLDPALQTSGVQGETRRADYFCKFLWKDGPYPAHAAFMIAKKLVEQGYNPDLWSSRHPQQFEMQFSFFLMGDDLKQLKIEDPEYRKRFERLTANVFRMGLYLTRQSVKKTGEALFPESQANQAQLILEYLKGHGLRPADAPLVAEVKKLLVAAKPLR